MERSAAVTPERAQQGRAPKAANIHDVAKHAKVSIFTVSAVINDNGRVSPRLRRRVEAAIRQLDYRPNLLARSLVKQRTYTIGIIVPDIANPFFPLVVRGAEDVAHKAGYSTVLCNSDNQRDKEERYLELLLSRRVDGILLTMAPGRLSPWLRRMLVSIHVPIVLVMRTSPNLKADVVLTDDYKGAFEAVAHLVRVGHRRIALVSGPLDVSNGAARWNGYRKALEVHNLPYDHDLVVEGDYQIESGYRAGLALFPRHPDAVFVANYLMTVGIMQAAEEMKMSCPDDFGLVSFDDYPWLGCFRPRLTTIELPKYELGTKSTQILLDRISGEKVSGSILWTLAPQLRVRESCGFARQIRNTRLADSRIDAHL
ncbi:MAG: LacI family DNA-binding transcriptional regulator [Candidatus Acidiferrales bacterium]